MYTINPNIKYKLIPSTRRNITRRSLLENGDLDVPKPVFDHQVNSEKTQIQKSKQENFPPQYDGLTEYIQDMPKVVFYQDTSPSSHPANFEQEQDDLDLLWAERFFQNLRKDIDVSKESSDDRENEDDNQDNMPIQKTPRNKSPKRRPSLNERKVIAMSGKNTPAKTPSNNNSIVGKKTPPPARGKGALQEFKGIIGGETLQKEGNAQKVDPLEDGDMKSNQNIQTKDPSQNAESESVNSEKVNLKEESIESDLCKPSHSSQESSETQNSITGSGAKNQLGVLVNTQASDESSRNSVSMREDLTLNSARFHSLPSHHSNKGTSSSLSDLSLADYLGFDPCQCSLDELSRMVAEENYIFVRRTSF